MIPSIPRPPDTFETARLRLRRPSMEDAPSIYARYASDPEVARYLPWRTHRDVEETQMFLSLLLNALGSGGTCAWVIEGREDRRLIGLTTMNIDSARESDSLSTEEERRQYYKVLIAYHLAQSEWGQGYATEAARALVDWALTEEEARLFEDIDSWFDVHLPTPPFYDDGNKSGAITWFKSSSTEMLKELEPLLALLRKYDVAFEVVETDDPGSIRPAHDMFAIWFF